MTQNSKMWWMPYRDLAVEVDPNRQTKMTWVGFQGLMAETLRGMERGASLRGIEEMYEEKTGHYVEIEEVGQLMYDDQILETLRETVGLNEEDFPMEIQKKDLEEEAEPMTVWDWMIQVL